MGNKNDGKADSSTHESHEKNIVACGQDGIQIHGNEDAKKLAKAYEELSKGGLTKEELKALQNMDQVLKGAELKVTDEHSTLIVQENKETRTIFMVSGDGHKQNTGFCNHKPGKGR